MLEQLAHNVVVWTRTVKRPDKTTRFDFLDGIRAMAAFYVLLFHILASGNSQGVRNLPYTSLVMFGHEAVVVFIVVSGYCLMLSPARSPDKSIRGGWRRFMKRRAWRILPPYYGALLAWPLFLTAMRGLKQLLTGVADYADVIRLLGDGRLLSHLFLIHNLRPDWNGAINPALWSIATEFQIYILFIWVLLPLWRRFGSGITIVAAFVIGLAPVYLLPKVNNLEWAAPHFVGLFALGMTGAVINLSTDAQSRVLRERLPWGLIAILFFAVFAYLNVTVPDLRFRVQWLTDTILGLATTACIVFCAKQPATAGNQWGRATHSLVLRILGSDLLVGLGRFSYSLYLTQLPFIAIIGVSLQSARVPSAIMESQAFKATVLIPLLVGAAYVFYLMVEQWFLPERLDQRNATG